MSNNDRVNEFCEELQKRNPHEPEFIQAVRVGCVRRELKTTYV